jgi:hypothetical protein
MRSGSDKNSFIHTGRAANHRNHFCRGNAPLGRAIADTERRVMSGLTALLMATLLTIGLLAAVPTIRWSRLRKPRLASPSRERVTGVTTRTQAPVTRPLSQPDAALRAPWLPQ